MKNSLQEEINSLRRRIEEIEKKILKDPSSDLTQKCPVCGMAFSDQFGRPIVMGFCCPNPKCPTGVYSTSILHIGAT